MKRSPLVIKKASKIMPRRELGGVPHVRKREVSRSGLDAYMDFVASQPCGVCKASLVQLHHPREGQGMSQRASDWLVLPICPSCHTGPHGIHGDRREWSSRKLTEMDVLADMIEKAWKRKLDKSEAA